MSFSQMKNNEQTRLKPYFVIPVLALLFLVSTIIPSLIRPTTTNPIDYTSRHVEAYGFYDNGYIYINVTNYSDDIIVLKKIIINNTIVFTIPSSPIKPGERVIVTYRVGVTSSGGHVFGEIIPLRIVYSYRGMEYKRSLFIIVRK